MKQKSKFEDVVRILLGAIRPEMKSIAKKLADLMPSHLKKGTTAKVMGRTIGSVAQYVEKKGNVTRETLSDFLEMVSDELTKSSSNSSNDYKERIRKAENLDLEKERIRREIEIINELEDYIKVKEQEKQQNQVKWQQILQQVKEALLAYADKIDNLRQKRPWA